LVQGKCLACGGYTEKPCDIGGCDPGLVVQNGQCVSSSTPCANFGDSCVPDNQPGTHCCQNSTNPAKCVGGFCKNCVPHGQQCLPNQTQICCDPSDSCKLDQATETTICDIPDK
jgi:hypothetical protein